MKSFAGQYIGNMVAMALPFVLLLGILLIALRIVAEVLKCLFERFRRSGSTSPFGDNSMWRSSGPVAHAQSSATRRGHGTDERDVVDVQIDERMSRKGNAGEAHVAEVLLGLPREYRVLNGVYLPLPDGTTTQIDHVVVSEYGVFVVETKNYSGWIFGGAGERVWTQTLNHESKHSFQSPIRQNYRHVCALSECMRMDKSYFRSVIVFAGDCEFKTEMPRNVMYAHEVRQYIMSFREPIIDAGMIERIAIGIGVSNAALGSEKVDAHVENLKKRHSPVRMGDDPLCPLCGSRMVLRRRRSDGNPFYGCSTYPKCRGIIAVE